ncbi:rap1 GTPase-GDP dissociation stimulator 1 [Thrips palmi]|uniref:Rap1 GTPase-GDP dissociation stimulator 1 n=1 Tax=Thrips palmi TaxID=161013 RepID=A0A6P8ZX14_THRPL|nr:rap1 GTPase-GDP dissociation stimulator 1 [Thrips palmi]
MAETSSIAITLEQKIDDLKIAIENKSDNVLRIVEDILSIIKENGIDSVPDVSIVPCVQLVLLLRWKSNEVIAVVANILAEVAKSEAGRERLATLQPPIAQQLVNLLQQKSSDLSDSGNLAVVTQVCRALGNMCYESERGQTCVLDAEGLEVLLSVLERAVLLANNTPGASTLRSVIIGFLLNLTISQDVMHQKLVALGGIGLLCQVLELDRESEDGCSTTDHAIVILGYLLDQVSSGDTILTDKVCQMLVQVLETFSSSSAEICESVLELLQTHAEDDSVKQSLAQHGLCQLLISLVEKYQPLVDDADEDTQRLFKLATDLIVIILNGDVSMTMLYGDGKGEVYLNMLKWVVADNADLQTTGILAVGNFARCDLNCIKMVESGVHKDFLLLLEKHNGHEDDARLPHALLSALRNLAIPTSNKAVILKAGALDILTPMINSCTLPVAFKLLATLRMLVDGQDQAAEELGKNSQLLKKLVEFYANDCHAGVQGEASRLLAWIIKNSRSKDVGATVIQCCALPPLVSMLCSEHAVMRNEALLALTLVSATQLPIAEKSLAESKVCARVAGLLTEHGSSMEKPMLCNTLALLGELVSSDVLAKDLAQNGVHESLTGLTTRKDISDLDELVTKLSSALKTT